MSRLERAARGKAGARYGRFRRHRDYRFLIYAALRTGSSSLGQALNGYLGIQCAMEPFNPGWGGDARGRVSDLPSLEREVQRLWRRYSGFKHVWDPNGFPFKGQPEFNDYLLTGAAARVILLNRRNVLRRIVSNHIAGQAGVFHLSKDADRVRRSNYRFGPLDISATKEQLAREREAIANVKRRLDETGVPYKMLWYEELFRADSDDQKRGTLGDIIAFITGRPFQATFLKSHALANMDPANAQTNVNSANTYEAVPNIHEIENELGCAETGFLFR